MASVNIRAGAMPWSASDNIGGREVPRSLGQRVSSQKMKQDSYRRLPVPLIEQGCCQKLLKQRPHETIHSVSYRLTLSENPMTYKLAARFSVALVTFMLLSGAGIAGQDDSSKSKKKPKNSDIDNIGTRDINKGNILPLMSLQKEIEIGQQLAAQVERQAKIVKDPVINEYVNRIEQNIVRNSDAKVPFSTKIIDSDEINARSEE